MTAPFLLDAAEAAKLLGVSLRTLRNLTKRADFPSPRTLGPRSFRWVRSELEAFACQLPPAKAAEPPALVAAPAQERQREWSIDEIRELKAAVDSGESMESVGRRQQTPISRQRVAQLIKKLDDSSEPTAHNPFNLSRKR